MTNPNPVAPKTDTLATQDDADRIARACPDHMVDFNALKRVKIRVAELESTLAAERASRLQAEEERDFARGRATAHAITIGRLEAELSFAANMVSALSKPSVSPEQKKP